MTDARSLTYSLLGALRDKSTRDISFICYSLYVAVVITYKLNIGTQAIALSLLASLVGARKWRWVPATTALCMLAAWTLCSWSTGIEPGSTFGVVVDLLKLPLIFAVAVNVVRTPAQIAVISVVYVLGYLVVPARVSILDYMRGSRILGRAFGPFIYGNSNDLALLLLLAFCVAMGLSELVRSAAVKWVLYTIGGIFLVGVLLTQSRGVFLATALVLVPYVVREARRSLLRAVGVIALAGVAISFAPDSLWERVGGLKKLSNAETVAEADPEGSARERFEIIKAAIAITKDNPILGVGPGAYPYANAIYAPHVGPRDTHNTYLNLTAELGLPGLALFLSVVGLSLREWTRRRSQAGSTPCGRYAEWLFRGTLGMLLAAAFGSYSKLAHPYLFLALLISASRTAQVRADPSTAVSANPHARLRRLAQ